MNPPFVSLCPEITRSDALRLMDWLDVECVTRHLSDSRHVSRFIEQVIGQVQLPILTHLFNQDGRFFMVCDADDRAVGFVRLVETEPVCQMVLVIGDRDNWGRRPGASAIREAMKLALLEMRVERLIAKVHPGNTCSLSVFQRSGLLLESQTSALRSYAMTSERYRRFLRESPAGQADRIHITETDLERLRRSSQASLASPDRSVGAIPSDLPSPSCPTLQPFPPDSGRRIGPVGTTTIVWDCLGRR